WREDTPLGHAEWTHSVVVHAVSEQPIGPYKVVQTVGSGHNPEVFRLKNGSYVVYVIDGYYSSRSINGPWEYDKLQFDNRDRPIIEGLSNLTFAQREDGSYLMVCRGGGIWVSEDGTATYEQVSDKSVYPHVEGAFEDPVIWRDNIQYHMIVNDWLGRVAYYLRSKDGFQWKTDPGEAYVPGITNYEDGTREDWFKYERIKILQDNLGRAIQANFAVIDTLKKEDKTRDRHSSKNIGIPLVVGRQIELLDNKEITESTKSISVKIMAEEGFDPHKDINVNSLRFGAPEEVNFGRGSQIKKIKKEGTNLILTFQGSGNGFTDSNFVGKLLGKTNDGKLLFGYSRLPWVDFYEPVLSARIPKITEDGRLKVEINNYGLVSSNSSKIRIEIMENKSWREIASGEIPKIDSFQNIVIDLHCNEKNNVKLEKEFRITMYGNNQNPVILIRKWPSQE
ncbi:glycoside hydrolase family protein, partial [Arenibacter sp. M-2]|uniref:glycoside hydrolase family protein n=1 Tax=Arenibacter sp. M-2 TaxID=3053612 RepID=UPI00256FB2A3